MSTRISSTTNEWPQKSMENKKPTDPLKCPRCDSCNTKFCYYNNYSLSQPRHFCKACKRYWTRGGTLRNVPVGGGCRKNKRVRRPPPSTSGEASNSSARQQPETDLTNPISNPLFYDTHIKTVHELKFPFSGFDTTRASLKTLGFDMINGLDGVRFSSGFMVDESYENGFNQDAITATTTSNSSLFSANFGSYSTVSSLLASRLQQQRFVASATSDEFSGLMPYEDMQILGGNGVNNGDGVKIEGENGLGLNSSQIGQINPTGHSSLLWTTIISGGGDANWFDPSNLGSSVPSLI